MSAGQDAVETLWAAHLELGALLDELRGQLADTGGWDVPARTAFLEAQRRWAASAVRREAIICSLTTPQAAPRPKP